MQLEEAIDLISCDIWQQQPEAARWADLGCGPGLFSYALSCLLPAGSTIYAIDKDAGFDARLFPGQGRNVQAMHYDFVQDTLPLRNLDGLLIANALHYAADKAALMNRLRSYLKPEAYLLVVEYDTDVPVPVWVPYPLSFAALSRLCAEQGLSSVTRLRDRPSLFRRSNLYAALVKL